MGDVLFEGGSRKACQRKGESLPFYQSFGKGDEPPAVLEEYQSLWPKGGYPEKNHSPSSEAFFCESSSGGGGGSSLCSDDARARGHLDDSDLHSRDGGKIEEGPQKISSKRLK